MSISPQKNSIAKVGLAKNIGKAKTGGINGAIKPTSKIAKSAQTGESTDATNSDSDDTEVSTDEDGTTWEAGKPISKDADKAASDTTKALWSGYWDFKKSELDNQRGMQQDQLAFQKQQMEAAMAQQNSGVGAGLASAGLGALGQALGALGQSKGGGGSSGGGGSATKPEEHKLSEAKPFEDQNKIVKVDSKGNPIINDPQKQGQNPSEQSNQVAFIKQGEETAFQGRPISHGEMQVADVQAQSYDSDNGLSIDSHMDIRGNQGQDIDLQIAQTDANEFAQEADEIEPEIPEIEIEEIDEDIA